MNLTRTAIARPIFIFMIMAAVFLLGYQSWTGMRRELNPDVSFPVVTITTIYPGTDPVEMNELISRRIEEAVSSVNNAQEITSTSQEGVSNVVVQFELGTDVDAALSDVRSKVDAIVNQLPREALKPTVSKFDNSAQPVLNLAFSSSKLSSRELRNLLDEKLQDRFAQIPGVASATVQGGDVREFQVQVDRDKLMSYGIGIVELQRAIQNANLNVPAGKLESGTQQYTVRVLNQFRSADDLRDMIFTINDSNNPMAQGRSVRLGNVAEVFDSAKERDSFSRVDGEDAVTLAVTKARDGNAVEITERANQVISQVQKDYANEELTIVKTFEQAKQIEESLTDLSFAIIFGIFLVAAIVFVFLHNLRGTIIVALAIPTSIFGAFIAMNAMGFTINNMSMLSLSLAVGVLVDDAIVVIENIYRHLKLGEDPRQAAINGRSEIGLAAIAITMADVVVFLPIAFMGGIVGQFFKPLALGFVAATLFSLFVSFTLTPLLAARWYRAGEDVEHPTGPFARGFERAFTGFENFYRGVLRWSLNHRWFIFIAGNVALFAVFMFIGGSFVPPQAGAAAAAQMGMGFFTIALVIGVITTVINLIRKRGFSLKYLGAAAAFGLVFPVAAVIGQSYAAWKKEAVFKFAFLPEVDAGQIVANVELPPGANLDQTEDVVQQIEKVMMADPDVKYVVSNVGTQGVGNWGGSSSGSNYAQVTATLFEKQALTDKLPWRKHEERLRSRSANSVAADFTQQIGRIAGATVKISASSGFGWGSPIQMSFSSDDREALQETAEKVRNGLAAGAVPGIINPDITSKSGKPELQIQPDLAAVSDAGITVAELGQAVRTLYQGNTDSKVRILGREYDINVMMAREDRDNPDLLASVPVAFKQGNPIFMSQVADVEQVPGVDKIDRRDRSEEIRVTADLLPGYAAGSVQAQIDQWMERENLVAEAVRYKPLGQADAQARESGFMLTAFLMGIILVYMLLASLYDNLLYPFIIQLAQPQAMVGALLALIITDKPFSLVGFIGLVALVGLVGKNAILLVDYTNTLRERGRTRFDALLEAGPTRLRPIMMTTLALILGMLPVALAIGRGSEFRETIGITIIGGISLSTLLTLLVIPCSYTIFDDLSEGISKLMGKRRHPAGAEPLTQGDSESEVEREPVEV